MLQLRNTDTSKGLKGIEIPAGDITFDLKLTSTITNANGVTDAAIDDEFKPLLFEYTDGSSTTGIFGRSVLSETQSVGYDPVRQKTTGLARWMNAIKLY